MSKGVGRCDGQILSIKECDGIFVGGPLSVYVPVCSHCVRFICAGALLPGPVHLAHRAGELAAVFVIMQAELAVAIRAVPVRLLVFLPQQLQCDAFALEFLMDGGIVRLRVAGGGGAGFRYINASRAASSSSAGNGQPKPCCRARRTAPFDIPVAAAIFSWLSFASNLTRRTSLILRMAVLLAGIDAPRGKNRAA
jgi:hypothetical protein